MGATLKLIKGEVPAEAPVEPKSIHVHPPSTLTAKNRRAFGLPAGFEYVVVVAHPVRRWARWVNPEVKP